MGSEIFEGIVLREEGTYKCYFFIYNFLLIFFVNKYRKYLKLDAGFTFNSFSLRLARDSPSVRPSFRSQFKSIQNDLLS